MSEPLSFRAEEQETGKSKYPRLVTLTAEHPEHGDVGYLKYFPGRRANSPMLIDRLEVGDGHRGKGYGSALMDEVQRRHPDMGINHGDRTDAGKDWWRSYTRGKAVRRGRTAALTPSALKYKLQRPPKTTKNPDGTKGLHVLHGQLPDKTFVSRLEYYPKPNSADLHHLEIQLLSVPRKHRGNGYAGQAMDELQRRYPGVPIDHGERTGDGEKWWDKYSQSKEITSESPDAHRSVTSARDLPCPDCEGTGRRGYEDQSWDCPDCEGKGVFHAADHWDPPKVPARQEDLFSDQSGRGYREKGIALAANPDPGTHVWRGEVRHKDDIANPSSVGLHWTVKPEQAILGNGAGSPEEKGFTKDHRHVLWQATVDHPDQIIPRSHPIWSGKHQSLPTEAEVRFKPGAKVHLNGAYIWDAEGQAHGTPYPRASDRTQAGWAFHPLDHHVTIEHNRPGQTRMQYQEDYPDLFRQGAFLPTQRLFGPTQGLDHRLFDGEHLKPAVREYIISTLSQFWEPIFGEFGWEQWAIVYFAGSEASEWTSPTREGNNDFDVLIGVDYKEFRGCQSRTSKYQTMSDQEITDEMNAGLRKLDEKTAAAYINVDGYRIGPFSNTWYVNKNSYDIRNIKPYAAYDVTHDRWAVKPPHLPSWNLQSFPEGPGLVQECQAVAAYVRSVLSLPEPYRTQQGYALWQHLHSDRGRAFSSQGEGWYDPGNVIEKWLDQEGLWDQLVQIMVRARAHPETLSAPADWSNNPMRHQAMPWSYQDGETPADHPEIKSVRHAGFAGYVGMSPDYEDSLGINHRENHADEFDEDAYENTAPEPTHEEQAHYDKHDEYPESYHERHDEAYQHHINQKAQEDEPDHEDDELHNFIGTRGADSHFWQNHGTLGMVSLKQPVYATQSHVSQRHIDKYRHNPDAAPHNPGYGEYLGNRAPMFVTHEGRLHAAEGHHRVAAALQRGDDKIHAWHYDADRHGIPEEEDD